MMRYERWALLVHDAVALAVGAPRGWWIGVLLEPQVPGQGTGTGDCREQILINAGERFGVEVRTYDRTWEWLRA
jgi:hypothetical protein